MLQLFVRSKGGTTVPVEVDPEARVADVLRKLNEALGGRPRRGHLCFGNERLPDECLLSDVGVSNQAELVFEESQWSWDPTSNLTRDGHGGLSVDQCTLFRFEDDNKVRFFKSTGETIK